MTTGDPDPYPWPESWRERAACRGYPTDLFYPDPSDHRGVTAAKRICEVCPVQMQCFIYALEHREKWGVWGGQMVETRRHQRRVREAV